VIAEVYPLAHLAQENCGLVPDAIVDEDAAPYPPGRSFDLQELTTEGYAALLRIERGRVRHREIFGPMRLHYGIFKLQAKRSSYVIAREEGRVVGAVGFTIDALDRSVRVFELISLEDQVIRILLSDLERAWTEKLKGAADLVEVEVSAHSPRMQRTLLELGYLPVAYVPALAFDEVERVDVVKMFRLAVPPEVDTGVLTPRCKAVADLVLRRFQMKHVLPRVAAVVHKLPLFAGLDTEQVGRLAGVCRTCTFKSGELLFQEGEIDYRMHVVLEGNVAISVGSNEPVGMVYAGECLGETSLLATAAHSATATARTRVETAMLEHRDLVELIRLRPDIGLQIYKNLAIGAGEKLKRVDSSIAHGHSPTSSDELDRREPGRLPSFGR